MEYVTVIFAKAFVNIDEFYRYEIEALAVENHFM